MKSWLLHEKSIKKGCCRWGDEEATSRDEHRVRCGVESHYIVRLKGIQRRIRTLLELKEKEKKERG